MFEPRGRPTPDEVQAILAHARQLRARYLHAMLARAWLRVTQPLVGRGARDALATLRTDAG